MNRLEGVRHWRRFFEGNADHAARARLLRLVSLVVLGIGLIALYRATENMNIAQVLQALARLTAGQLLLAWLCTILSYLAIAGYDWSALCYIGKRVPSSVVTLAGICAGVIGNSAGAAMVSGGSVKHRIYTRFGLNSVDVARITAIGAGAFVFGSIAVTACTIVVNPLFVARVFGFPSILPALTAILVIVLYAAVLIIVGCRDRAWMGFGPIRFRLPSLSVVAVQIGSAFLELGCAAACLYILLPESNLPFFGVLAIYSIGFSLGLLSHVPGGLGVLDGILLLALGGSVPSGSLASAILVFRAIYYLLPLGFTLVALSCFELSMRAA